MSKLLVVFGATGNQGISVVNAVLSDPLLSKEYKLRAITRDTTKPVAQSLQQKGVEVIEGSFDDESSIHAALKDAHTVYLMTNSTLTHEQGKTLEVRQGKTVADAAVSAGVQYIIYSTEFQSAKISNGTRLVENFDLKFEVETYIRGLPIKSAFVAPGSFMQNFSTMMTPRPVGDGTYSISNVHSPETEFPWIDAEADNGKFVAAILAEPDRFQGKVFAGASEVCNFGDVTKLMSKISGKTVKYVQIPESQFREKVPSVVGDVFVNMFLFFQDFGYYGPHTRKEVEWAVGHARGRLTTLEEYLDKNLKLAD